MSRQLRPAPFRTGTALARFERLEALGIWREGPGAAPREVVVALGASSLVLRDTRDAPLGHWALAGVRILERSGEGAVLAMTPQGYETLAIADRQMLAAIETLGGGAAGAAPRRARRRAGGWALAFGALALAALMLVAAAPMVLRTQADALLPAALAERLGEEVLLRIIEARGPVCADPAASVALARLAAALPGAAVPVRIVPLGRPMVVLPGGAALLDASLLAAAEGPGELAGWLALADALAAAEPPAGRLLAAAGPVAALRFWMTGELDEDAAARATTAALAPPRVPPEAMAEVAARLARAAVPVAPLVDGLRRSGEMAAAAALAAAAGPAGEPRPLLPADGWAALRAACG